MSRWYYGSGAQNNYRVFSRFYPSVHLHNHTRQWHQLQHEADHQRIRYKKICGHCGAEVLGKDIVKGYEYDKDKYVIVTDDDIEKIKSEKDKTIQILRLMYNQVKPKSGRKNWSEVFLDGK